MTEFLLHLLDALSGAVIPAAAIVISTGLAVLLFLAERWSSNKARQQERQDRLLEDIIASLAFFVSVNPLAETWAGEFRRLRAQVVILQALPSPRARLLGDWLALEGTRGMRLMTESMVALQKTDPASVDSILAAMKPSHDWADYCINSIASWMRGDADDDHVRARIDDLRGAHT